MRRSKKYFLPFGLIKRRRNAHISCLQAHINVWIGACVVRKFRGGVVSQMKNCPICSKEVSKETATYSECSHMLRNRTWLRMIFAVIIILFNIGAMSCSSDKIRSRGGTVSKILCKGKPVKWFLELTRDDVRKAFGAPASWSTDDGYFYFNKDDENIEMVFSFDDSYNVVSVDFESTVCEIDGVALNKNAVELVGTLGQSTCEEYEEGMDGDIVRYVYEQNGYSISFSRDDWDERISNIYIEHSDLNKCTKDNQTPQPQAKAQTPPKSKLQARVDNAIRVTAETYMKDCDSNQIAGNTKYRGKDVVIINSRLEDIQEQGGVPYININSGMTLRLAVSETEKAAKLRKGQQVTVLGVGAGCFMGAQVTDGIILQ